MMQDPTATLLALLLDWICKGFLIFGCAFVADHLLRRSSASLRHSIWLIGSTTVLLLPIVSTVVPSMNVSLFRLDFLSGGPLAADSSMPLAAQSGWEWSAPEIFLAVYLAVALFVFAWQLVGRGYACTLRSRASKITDVRITGELQRLKAAMGIRSPIELLSSDLVSIPFSTGFLRPVMVLPRVTFFWRPSVLESVLVHELAHIKRRDILTRIVAQISCCIHWINPLAWYGFARMIMEQEIACDNLVLERGTKASEYAQNLLTLAEVRRGRLDFAVTALGRRAELQGRLLEILKPTRSRRPLHIGGSVILLTIASGLLLPLSALNLWDGSSAAVQIKPPADAIPQGQPTVKKISTDAAKTSTSTVQPLPDLDTMKKKVEQKIKDMKAQGISEAEIKKFSADAEAKINSLKKEISKQEKAKKQLEMENPAAQNKGKGGKG